MVDLGDVPLFLEISKWKRKKMKPSANNSNELKCFGLFRGFKSSDSLMSAMQRQHKPSLDHLTLWTQEIGRLRQSWIPELLRTHHCCRSNLITSSLSLHTATAKGVKPWSHVLELHQEIYLPVIKHSNGKSPTKGYKRRFLADFIYFKLSIFHSHDFSCLITGGYCWCKPTPCEMMAKAKVPLTRTRRSALELIRTRKAPTWDVAAAKCRARPCRKSKRYRQVDWPLTQQNTATSRGG